MLVFMQKIYLQNQKIVSIILYIIMRLNVNLKVDLNDDKKMGIALKNCSTNDRIELFPKYAEIFNEDNESFKLSSFNWNNNDIFGCGLVYPPTNKMNEEFPFAFFTHNGKQIGKGNIIEGKF
uniref:Uncharacterized protein n=1 Tax=Meloidogyne enterolobii TaxID=390850 RepID=A0A6V7VLA8_MELEN|nr:unnamed protein product [Meloidogyne enterolobii]